MDKHAPTLLSPTSRGCELHTYFQVPSPKHVASEKLQTLVRIDLESMPDKFTLMLSNI